jgi:hypothetical protein
VKVNTLIGILVFLGISVNGQPNGKVPEGTVFFPDQPSFGVVAHTNYNGAELKTLGIRWVRNGISWRDVEPKEKKKYDFSGYGKPINHFISHGMNLLTVLSLEGQSELYPKPTENLSAFIEGYAGYARACAHHFKGKVKIWELGNEPEVFTIGGVFNHPEHYTKIALTAAKAIREVDPDAHIAALSVGWLDRPFILRCLELGLLKEGTIDVVTFHGYHREGLMAEGKLKEDIAWLRQQVRTYGRPDRKVIVVDSERGYSLLPFLHPKAWDSWKNEVYSETEQAAYMIRHFLTEMSAGVEVSVWYKDMSGESGFSLYEGGPGSRLRPMGAALRNLAGLFDANPKQMINSRYRVSLVDLPDTLTDPNSVIKIRTFLKTCLKTSPPGRETLLVALWNPVEAFDGKILHSRQRIGERYFEAWRSVSPQDKVEIPLQVTVHGLKAQRVQSVCTADLLSGPNEPVKKVPLGFKPSGSEVVTEKLNIGPVPTIIIFELKE